MGILRDGRAGEEEEDEVEEEETGAHEAGGQDHFARMMEDNQMATHSGPPGGGLRFWGKIFRVPFFGSFGFPTCQMIRKKYSNIRGKPFPV